MLRALRVIGINHRKADTALRELAALDDRRAVELIGTLCGQSMAESAVVLSTCNRIELYLAGGRADSTPKDEVIRVWGRHAQATAESLSGASYEKQGVEAAAHMVRVASGLDSMVLGEPQVFGQWKHAIQIAVESGHVTPWMLDVTTHATRAAKKIRSETAVGKVAIGIAYVGVKLAEKIFDDIAKQHILLVGAGDMAELTARHLQERGATDIRIANRTVERAAELAQQFGGSAIGLDRLASELITADIVITSAAVDLPLIHAADVAAAMQKRKNKPLFFVDLAVPRNVAPDVREIRNVFVYDLDDLSEISEQNLAKREQLAAEAEGFVQEAVKHLLASLARRQADPMLASLYRNFHAIRQRQLEQSHFDSRFGPEQYEQISAFSEALVKKLLHLPATRLKELAGSPDYELYARVVTDLFGDLAEELPASSSRREATR